VFRSPYQGGWTKSQGGQNWGIAFPCPNCTLCNWSKKNGFSVLLRFAFLLTSYWGLLSLFVIISICELSVRGRTDKAVSRLEFDRSPAERQEHGSRLSLFISQVDCKAILGCAVECTSLWDHSQCPEVAPNLVADLFATALTLCQTNAYCNSFPCCHSEHPGARCLEAKAEQPAEPSSKRGMVQYGQPPALGHWQPSSIFFPNPWKP